MNFSKLSRKLNAKKILGQGMSEYLIIVGLIAVAGIAVMGFMGGAVRHQVSGMAAEIAGGDGNGEIKQAASNAASAAAVASAKRSLSNYDGQNTSLTNTQ